MLNSSTQLGVALAISTGSDGAPPGRFCVTPLLNINYIVDAGLLAGRLSDGNYTIYAYPGYTAVGEAAVTVGTNSIQYSIPIRSIGNLASPTALMAAAANGMNPHMGYSDCAPDAGYGPVV